MKNPWLVSILIILGHLLVVIPCVSDQPAVTSTYSFVHLSDTQNLATYHPDTYDFTFSYLESLKNSYNISAIIITGDLVNSWNKKTEWNAYTHARDRTTIPIFITSGNHDTNSGKNDLYYSRYAGGQKKNYVTSLGDFNFIGINYVPKTLTHEEFATLRNAAANSSHSFTIIATHYYLNGDGTLSPLGKDIDKELISQPTLILAGHIHADFVRVKTIGSFPVIEDLTNYQDGDPVFLTNKNYSAGTLYTVTAMDGRVVKITCTILRILPEQSLSTERVLYDSTPEFTLNVNASRPLAIAPTFTLPVVKANGNNTWTSEGNLADISPGIHPLSTAVPMGPSFWSIFNRIVFQ